MMMMMMMMVTVNQTLNIYKNKNNFVLINKKNIKLYSTMKKAPLSLKYLKYLNTEQEVIKKKTEDRKKSGRPTK